MLDSLPLRRRGVLAAHLLHQLTGGRVPPPRERTLIARWTDALVAERAPSHETGHPVTEELYGRLSAQDVAQVEADLDEAGRQLFAQSTEVDRRRYTIALALHRDYPGIEERTGLLRAMPPEEVHMMGRGFWATGGSYYYGDLLTEALTSVSGGAMPTGRYLDFGSSSGRVLRALAAVHEGIEWHGCDPLADAIAWADAHLPMGSFVQSPHEPPLPYDDEQFDVVYAISVWSHFRADAAVRWLDEMRRIVRPGGLLLMTTQGWATLGHVGRHRLWDAEDVHAVGIDLAATGTGYTDVFGIKGDHGIVREDWGWGFMTLGWLAQQTTPDWSIELFREGLVEGSQDLVVLRRRGDR